MTTRTLPMRRLLLCMMVTLIALSDGAHAASPEDNPAIAPTDRLAESWWAARHESVLQQLRDQPDTQLLLIGDSITNNYDKADLPDENFRPTWDQFYGSRGAVNLGFSGDTTAGGLWRLQHGEVDAIKSKLACVLICSNNSKWANYRTKQTDRRNNGRSSLREQRFPKRRTRLPGRLR